MIYKIPDFDLGWLIFWGLNDIESFDAAFFTGTSPKAIAISNIGDLKFDVQNNLMNKVIGLFDDLIEDYLK